MQALTLFDAEPYLPPPAVANDFSDTGQGTAEASAYNGAGEVVPPDHPSLTGEGNPAMVLVGLIGLLVVLGFLQKESKHLASQGIAFNIFNFAFVILATMVGFVLMKVVFTKFKVPGLSQVVHAA